jgi:hypothetical protein
LTVSNNPINLDTEKIEQPAELLDSK